MINYIDYINIEKKHKTDQKALSKNLVNKIFESSF